MHTIILYLKVSEPDSIVQTSKVEDVINEWLAFRMVIWSAEDLRMHVGHTYGRSYTCRDTCSHDDSLTCVNISLSS